MIFIADHKDDIYNLRGSNNTNYSAHFSNESINNTINKYADVKKQHCRLGHLNLKDLMEYNKENIRELNITN